MTAAPPPSPAHDAVTEIAITSRFEHALDELHRHHDRFFAWLLVVQWIATIVLAFFLSPHAWSGTLPSHLQVLAAILLGGVVSLFPAWLGLNRPGRTATRYAIGIAQMLMSALLIHLTDGRSETHFHVFASLAFLALYRDSRVLFWATGVIVADHAIRGVFWPESIFGVTDAPAWRTVEHAFWIFVEVAFLTLGIRRNLAEMRAGARDQLSLEGMAAHRERAERDRTQALAESDTRFRAYFQDNPVGLYRISADGDLQLANPALLKLLGYSSVEEMRVHRNELRETDAEASHRDFLDRVIAKGAMEGQESIWVRRDGTKLTLRESARAVRGPDGKIQHIDGSAEDVTEHRQLEERYTQAQKVQAIGQLAGGIAHDFNNIVTAITGFADLLLVDDDLSDNQRRRVTEIRKASDRAAALTKQMLAFSRKQTLQPRVLHLNTVVADLEKMLQRLLGEHIQIITDLARDLAMTRVDSSQIQQVILNLAVNARDAMPDGGKLTIETANLKLDAAYARLHPGVKAGDYVLLSVSDTGTGIRPEIRDRLFEPFFTTKAPGTGTGLGLATCHGIVTQSGGHITVYSEMGCGSTFKVFLPASKGATDTAPSTAPFSSQTKPSRGRETILLVEDEPQVRELAQEVLTSCGYQVITTTNGREALEYCTGPNSEQIEIIITDVVMPEMGGRELVRKVRKTSPNIPVIFTSGFTFDAIRGNDMLEPGFHFLSKPYAMAVLAKKVREVLDEPVAQ